MGTTLHFRLFYTFMTRFASLSCETARINRASEAKRNSAPPRRHTEKYSAAPSSASETIAPASTAVLSPAIGPNNEETARQSACAPSSGGTGSRLNAQSRRCAPARTKPFSHETRSAKSKRDDQFAPIGEPPRSARMDHRAESREMQPLDRHMKCPERQQMAALMQRSGQKHRKHDRKRADDRRKQHKQPETP